MDQSACTAIDTWSKDIKLSCQGLRLHRKCLPNQALLICTVWPIGGACAEFVRASALAQCVGDGWEWALKQLHTCTCAWTNTRKTGLRVSHSGGLPLVRTLLLHSVHVLQS